AAAITVPSIGSRRPQHHFRSLPALVRAKVDTRGKQHDRSSCWQNPCRGGIPPLTREQAELFHAQAPRLATGGGSSPHRAELPVSQFPRGASLPSKNPRINSRLRSLGAHPQPSTPPPPRHH